MNILALGGNAPIYLSNTLIRVDDKSKLKASEGFGIEGSLVELTLIKSRTNRANQTATLVFDHHRGFDNELSLFLMLKEKGLVKGAGSYYYLEGCEHIKFAQKNFKQKLFENPELQEAFTSLSVKCMQEELDGQYDQIQVDIDRGEDRDKLYTNMMDRMNASLHTA